MSCITEITARATRDSRGKSTVLVFMSDGISTVSAKVPSGKSAGSREARELRDDDGAGVSRAIAHITETIAPALVGSTLDPGMIDARLCALDGTPDKSHLGANAILGVSIAATKLSATASRRPLWKFIADRSGHAPGIPALYMNMMNGGTHASFRLPFQEYIAVVNEGSAAASYAVAKEVFERLGASLVRACCSVEYGDEGGYAPEFSDIEKPLIYLRESADKRNVGLALDAAASEFFHDGVYTVLGRAYTSAELLALYQELAAHHQITSIEDPFDENDLHAFAQMVGECGARLDVVGDDLTVTNPHLIKDAALHHRANAVIIKPNQIGTVSETLEAVRVAKEAGWKVIASHRSGETDDTFIADLAVGIGAWGLKAGAPTQIERRVKYERLVEIEKEMGKQ